MTAWTQWTLYQRAGLVVLAVVAAIALAVVVLLAVRWIAEVREKRLNRKYGFDRPWPPRHDAVTYWTDPPERP